MDLTPVLCVPWLLVVCGGWERGRPQEGAGFCRMSMFEWTDFMKMLLRREQLKLADLERDEVARSEWV